MTKPLTIACAGTHGSGKSTLTNALADVLHLDPINISRPTTAAQQLGYAKAADVPPERVQLFQWMGLFEQIHQERIRLERPKDTRINTHAAVGKRVGEITAEAIIDVLNRGFVSDRSVVDFLAYYRYRVPEYERLSEYRQLVEAYARKYSVILYLPPNPNGVVDDNRRFIEGTEQIDKNIVEIFREFSLTNVVQVPWDTVENRVAYVINTLNDNGIT